jgi:hypothetical protein
MKTAASLSAAVLFCVCFLAAAPAAGVSDPSSPAPATPLPSARPSKAAAAGKPRASAPIDFSGTWVFDERTSVNANYRYRGSILTVTQTGNHIWIQPAQQGKGSEVLAEEIVADGRPYEKALGPAGKGTVTASWSADKTALEIEVRAGPRDQPSAEATQHSIWRLSADRKIWVRESTSVSQGKSISSRVVFRSAPNAGATPTRVATPRPKTKAG